MANFTNQDVMKLREQTGVGMMDCKKALVATDGDFDEAVKYLREKGMASAAKKASRVAAEGLVKCFVSESKNVGIAVEVNCETDFVARSEQFVALVDKILKQISLSDAATVEQLLAEKYCDDSSKTVNDLVAEAVAAIGEKISVRRFTKYVVKGGIVESYVHMGGKIGVLVEIKSDAPAEELTELAHNVAMHIAAAHPTFLAVSDVDEASIAAEREIIVAQTNNEGKPKPANIVEKMVQGRIQKYFKEVCLLEQEYVRDTSMNVQQVVAQCAQRLDTKVEIVRFVRYEMGEGIEKRVDNFVDEIAQQLSSIK